jgi:hypothetical protein
LAAPPADTFRIGSSAPPKEQAMTSITADDIRVLARSEQVDRPVLAFVDGEAAVLPEAEVAPADILYTRPQLVEEFGEDITDVEADILAAGLNSLVTPTKRSGHRPRPA